MWLPLLSSKAKEIKNVNIFFNKELDANWTPPPQEEVEPMSEEETQKYRDEAQKMLDEITKSLED